MKKIIFLLFFAVLNTACASVYAPCKDTLQSIQKEKYNRATNSCVDKVVSFRRYLTEEKFRIHAGIDESYPAEPHCWIEVFNAKSQTWHLLDPTWEGPQGWEVKFYPERKSWIEFDSSATAEEIKKYEKISKIFWENIPKKYIGFFQKIAKGNIALAKK